MGICNMDWVRKRRRLVYHLKDLVNDAIRDTWEEDPKWKKIYDCECNPPWNGDSINVTVRNNKPAQFEAYRCKDRWGCPICVSRYLYGERKELKELFVLAECKTYLLVMVVFTHPHKSGQSLDALVTAHNKAKGKLKGGPRFQKIKTAIGFIGSIAVNHLVYSRSNGWHYHTHEIWLIKDVSALEDMKPSLSEIWYKECQKEFRKVGINFDKSQEHDMRDMGVYLKIENIEPSIASYLCRFLSTPSETSLWETDNSGGHGYDAFSLLGSDIPNRKELFLEYLHTMKGRSRVRISKGLKTILKEENPEQRSLSDEQNNKNGGESHAEYKNVTEEASGENRSVHEKSRISFLKKLNASSKKDDSSTPIPAEEQDIKAEERTEAEENIKQNEGSVLTPSWRSNKFDRTDVKTDDNNNIFENPFSDPRDSGRDKISIPIDNPQIAFVCSDGLIKARVLEYAESMGTQLTEMGLHDFIKNEREKELKHYALQTIDIGSVAEDRLTVDSALQAPPEPAARVGPAGVFCISQ